MSPSGKTASEAHKASVLANFTLAGDPDALDGVIGAVYHELKFANQHAEIYLQEAPTPYIRIVSATEKDAMALIRTAQQLAEHHMSNPSAPAKSVFVEPPANRKTGDIQIAVKAHPVTKEGRPKLAKTERSAPGSAAQALLDKYKRDFTKALCEAFSQAARLHTSLQLRVHLGYYMLRSYKTANLTLEQFERMVKNPRAAGHLDTLLGTALDAKALNINRVMRMIQAADSPCRLPMDNRSVVPTQVVPIYIFETWYGGDRYEAELEIVNKPPGVAKEQGLERFLPVRTKTVPRDADIPRFEATSISLGRDIDWKITVTASNENVPTPPAVEAFLKTGRAELRGDPYDFHCYPTVSFGTQGTLAARLSRPTMKSIYRFNWKNSGYVVQLTINRQWRNFLEASQKKEPRGKSFEVTIYADNWDADSRVMVGQAVGSSWGDDLQGLLRAGGRNASGSALDAPSRVKGLIETILEVRDFFQGLTRPSSC
ncbi:hypothetical protein GGR50DRAFT_703541 [Xylaria sp. CBS 124048]|nr:hypothetical protein GGR50DRAFT_703541 [Xylaria sp. CBS 124048]